MCKLHVSPDPCLQSCSPCRQRGVSCMLHPSQTTSHCHIISVSGELRADRMPEAQEGNAHGHQKSKVHARRLQVCLHPFDARKSSDQFIRRYLLLPSDLRPRTDLRCRTGEVRHLESNPTKGARIRTCSCRTVSGGQGWGQKRVAVWR